MLFQNKGMDYQHVCGLYYNVRSDAWRIQKTYLPLVELEAHATVLAMTSRTVLTQTFLNPSVEKGIQQVRYTFPLYDGVSVVGFTCQVGDRTIVGQVKEREKAKVVFKEAVARGETAGLLEQLPDASDVFSTTVGNIPPGAQVLVKITYLGELKHDMEVDGIRYTIPTMICPRYGNYPGVLHTSDSTESCSKSIYITVDVEMAEGSFIQKIQSPSHPIAMTMGTTSVAPRAEPTMHKASASLTLGTSSLETDFILQIVAKDSGVPKAVLESHPTLPNHRALMATFVPKFTLPPEKPELVFLCDRSGSMENSRITLAVQALKVFLKSLPIGVKFNIGSFGSTYSFLWPRSVTYNQDSLTEAMQHVASFSANYGGTEMLGPLRATIEQRYRDMALDVMLLTDGEIWNQQALFSYLNEVVGQSKGAPVRVFTLGVGNGVSHALIEGIAKAGDGFSQSVGEGEMMDTKVVRMLKGALSPHVRDYTLEVRYGAAAATDDDGDGDDDDGDDDDGDDDDDDFEVVEKVADSLKVKLDLESQDKPKKKPISLFDPCADPDEQTTPAHDETGEDRYAHLPQVSVPKILQAPQTIPSLFAFNRTTVYLLLGPDAPQTIPKSVVLHGTSSHGPLELEVPVQVLPVPGETIHQLAAKKAISELEQGRGWLTETRDDSDTLLKTKFEGRFSDMVEREAVRLGVQFQVGGKWCSFVAVESRKKNGREARNSQDWDWLDTRELGEIGESTSTAVFDSRIAIGQAPFGTSPGLQQLPQVTGSFSSGNMLFGQQASQIQQQTGQRPAVSPFSYKPTGQPASGSLFEMANHPSISSPPGPIGAALPGPAAIGGASPRSVLFGNAQPRSPGAALFGSAQPSSPGPALFQSSHSISSIPPPLFGNTNPQTLSFFSSSPLFNNSQPPSHSQPHFGHSTPTTSSRSSLFFRSTSTGTSTSTAAPTPSATALLQNNPAPVPTLAEPILLLHHLIALQSFSGSWPLSPDLARVFTALHLPLDPLVPHHHDATPEELATAMVVALLEERMQRLQGSWELIVEKARAWLQEQGRVELVAKVRGAVVAVGE